MLGELGGMRSTFMAIATLAVASVAWPAEPVHRDALGGNGPLVSVGPSVAVARRAGLRVLESKHLVLATDRPERAGDGVAELPAVFDQAFDAWCDHYGMNPADHANWRCFGCLMVDRERFRAAGLLPDWLPPFKNGFCDRNRFWLLDQSNPAYRRHLLLHEGVHAFTLTLRGLATPVWYNEGIAEYLATHRLEPDAKGGLRFASSPIPARPEDVEQLGRIEKILELRAAKQVPSLDEVLSLSVAEHGAIADYAASWAVVAMLAKHPVYARGFGLLERGPLGPDFNKRLATVPGWDASKASRDFDAFTADVDYGFDFSRMAIDWSAGVPLAGPWGGAVDAGRGWQNAGVALVAGRRYAFTASGRVGLGSVTDTRSGAVTPLESEADGISLAWYRGRPTGRLLVGQWVEKAQGGGRPRFEVLADGSAGEFTAVTDGPLFMRINGNPAQLADRKGTLSVTVRPMR